MNELLIVKQLEEEGKKTTQEVEKKPDEPKVKTLADTPYVPPVETPPDSSLS
jgi:hypothetical protein